MNRRMGMASGTPIRSVLTRLGVLVGLALCTVPSKANAEAKLHLEIVSPHWEGMRYEIATGFNRYRLERGEPTVEINWLDVGGTSDILRFVNSEFKRSPQGIGVDLVYGGGIDPFMELKKARLLAPISATAFEGIDLAQQVAGNPLHDPEREFASAVVSTFGILCNRTLLLKRAMPQPKSWSDLADPRFATWLSLGDPRRSGSNHLMFEVFLQGFGWERGWEFIGRISSYARVILPSSPQVGRDVVNGEAACGLQIDSHATAQIAQFGAERLTFTIPLDLPVMNGDGVAILRGAPNSELAQAFVQYLLSEAGQRRIYLRRGVPGGPEKFDLARVPIRPELLKAGLPSAVTTDPFAAAGTMKYDPALGARRWNIVNDLARVFLIDRVTKPNQTFSMPVTEAMVEKLAQSEIWKTPQERLKVIASWRKLHSNGDRTP
jgi:iron(III) transport system substrate-binding protein